MVNKGLYSGSIRSLIYNLLGTITVYLTGGFNLARLCIIIPNRRKMQKNTCNILESPPNLFIPGDQYATLIHEIAYPTIQCLTTTCNSRVGAQKKKTQYIQIVDSLFFKNDIPYKVWLKIEHPKIHWLHHIVGCISHCCP